MEIDVVKKRVEHIGLEGGDILKPPFTMQMVEVMTKKSN
jgi:hypothetical protein